MARNDTLEQDEATTTVVGDGVTNDTIPGRDLGDGSADNGSENGSSPDLDKLMTDFAFRGPVSLRMAVETAAHEAKVPVSQFLVNTVASAVGVQVQPGKARTKMSDEQRKAREQELRDKAKAERARVQALLKQARGDGQTTEQSA